MEYAGNPVAPGQLDLTEFGEGSHWVIFYHRLVHPEWQGISTCLDETDSHAAFPWTAGARWRDVGHKPRRRALQPNHGANPLSGMVRNGFRKVAGAVCGFRDFACE